MDADVTPMNADESIAQSAWLVLGVGELAFGAMSTRIRFALSAFIGVTSASIDVPKTFATVSPLGVTSAFIGVSEVFVPASHGRP